MQIVSVRFGVDQLELIQDEAVHEGVSASQFIRDAAYARAVLYAAKRNALTVQLFDKVLAVVEREGHDDLSAELRSLLDNVRHANGDGDRSEG